MKSVGIRELKSHLSEYLRLVAAGEVVQVTERGRLVAEIRQPELNPDVSDYPMLALAAREGKVRLGAPRTQPCPTETGIQMPEGTAQALLDALREEG